MEIKFRAWNQLSDEMLSFNEVCSKPISELNTKTELLWMQFTGLLDKNGKEIYCGDVVQVRGGKKPRGGKRPFYVTEVVFYRGMFTVKDNRTIYHNGSVALRSAEIIGNIYQDEHLLK